jgi:hemolysin activation/secretion protein
MQHLGEWRRIAGMILLGTFVSGVRGPALAQTAIPGPAQPPQLQERFRTPPTPTPPTGPTLPQTPLQPTPPAAELEHFRLAEIDITGVTVYSQDELRSLYADLLGNDVTLAQLIDVANKLTTKYRGDGYILAQAVVPEQSASNGVVRIVAVEGFIDQVTIEGDVAGPRSLLDEFTQRIRNARPLTATELERNLLLIGDLPGVNVQSVIEPSATTFGAADLHVILKALPAQGFASVDNRGSRYAGPWAAAVGGSEYSQLGLYEQLDLLYSASPFSPAFRYIQGQAAIPLRFLTASGDQLQFFGAGTHERPTIPVAILPFGAKLDELDLHATYFHPIIRSRAQNLTGRFSFIWRDESTFLSTLPASTTNPTNDHVRELEARGTYDLVDSFRGVNLVDGSINQGLPILGASRTNGSDISRSNATPTFTYLTTTLSRLQDLGHGFAVFASVSALYSFNPLLPSERFGIGGSQFGRGFAPGNITGDRGFAYKIEPRYGDRLGMKFFDSYQLYAFYDGGETWDIGSPVGQGRLTSVGTGVRLNVNANISVNPEVAHQLSGTPNDDPGARHETRFLISIVARF